MLMCLTIAVQPMAISGIGYWEIHPNWKLVATDKGPIMFESTAYFDGLYFQDGYVYFNNLRFPGGYSWGTIGFSSSSNANVTISKTDYNEIKYKVNAPTGNESISMISLPSSRTIQSVTGATSWSQANTVVTVNVNHASEQEIIISWASNTISNDVQTTTNILIYMFPLIFLSTMFVLFKNPSEWRTILTIAMLIAIMGFFSWLFYSWRM